MLLTDEGKRKRLLAAYERAKANLIAWIATGRGYRNELINIKAQILADQVLFDAANVAELEVEIATIEDASALIQIVE